MNRITTPETKEIIVRKLGGLERYHLMLQNFLHTNVVVHARLTGRISEDMLRRSLDLLQKRHPLMSVRIDRRRSGARFMSGGVPPIPLSVLSAPEKSWCAVAEDELNMPLPIDRGPLLRCVLVHHEENLSTILITYSHTIGDGLAGAYMMRDLLRFCYKTGEKNTLDTEPLGLKSAMEYYFPARTRGFRGFLSYAGVNQRYMKQLKLKGGSFTPEYDGTAPLHDRRIQIIPRLLDRAAVTKLSEAARREGTTINSALVAAHLMAFARDRGCPAPVPIALMSAVNLRDRLEVPAGEAVSNFAGSCNSVHLAGAKEGFWDLAREHRANLLEGIAADEPMLHLLGLNIYDALIRLVGHDNAAARRIDGFYGRFKQKMTIVSNMGILDMDCENTGLTVDSLGFASSSRASGMIYSIIATVRGCLTWNFVGTDPLYSRAHLERIADHALTIVMENISTQAPAS